MPKPDPALLDPARFPFTCQVEPRFGDLDVNLHINNVALTGMVEESRVRFRRAMDPEFAHKLNQEAGDRTWLVASLSIEFLGEAFYPRALEIHCALAHIGRTSQTIVHLVRQKEHNVAFAQSVIVSAKDGAPAPLPDAMRDAAREWLLTA